MDASSSMKSKTDPKRRRSSSDKPPQSDDDNLSPPVKDDPSLKKMRVLSNDQEPASESGISTDEGGSDSATFISHTSEVKPTEDDQRSDYQGDLISDGPQWTAVIHSETSVNRAGREKTTEEVLRLAREALAARHVAAKTSKPEKPKIKPIRWN